jgi:5'(3')-deoxyribonucleotidase
MEKEKINILLDMDGVLADFITSAVRVFNKNLGTNVTMEQYATEFGQWGLNEPFNITVNKAWEFISKEENFWIDIKPYPWAKELYEWLKTIGDVTIITSPSLHEDCATQKMIWLKKHLEINTSDVFIGSKKYLMAGNGILIDDYPVNCEKFTKSRGKAILIPSNWNTVNLTFDKIKEVIELGIYEVSRA